MQKTTRQYYTSMLIADTIFSTGPDRYCDAITSTGARLHVWCITHALLLVREFVIAVILSIVCWLETHHFTCRSTRNHTSTFNKVSPHSTASPHSRSTAIFFISHTTTIQQYSITSLMSLYTTPDSSLYLCCLPLM